MKKACRSTGAAICAKAVINWSGKRRESQIADGVNLPASSIESA
ncbi:MAG: hypothetical protein ACOYU3_00645 [Bacillota bacterium]